MSNVHNTKYGELCRFRRQLREAGFIIPPKALIRSGYDSELGRKMLQRKLGRLKTLSTPEGPFLPYLMLRNNGDPKGTGKGDSLLTPLDASLEAVINTIALVQHSDPEARGVILQSFVGQFMLKNEREGTCFAPFLSGIAYTPEATERKNAIIEWVFGHPASAVRGAGNYLAFNDQNIEGELASTQFYGEDKQTSLLMDQRDSGGRIEISTHFDEILWMNQAANIPIPKVKELMGKVAAGVMAFKQALYLEWALTYIKDEPLLFALQVSEVINKLAGLPTRMHNVLHRLPDLMSQACVRTASSDMENFKKRYMQALENPQVIAAGFDIAGKDRQEFTKMVWLPDITDLKDAFGEEPFVLALDRRITVQKVLQHQVESCGLRGIVEIDCIERTSSTFRGHVHGFCGTEDILGLSGVENMSHKLSPLLPKEYEAYKGLSELRITGKFVLKVDETVPFGTLTVKRIDGVKKLRSCDEINA
ncbi:MAG: hypothetical protein PHS02_03560 [Candidatus ainarchaeum sp.]|nr:hypothetical protein [Candidatus ainarchaeum sp.]